MTVIVDGPSSPLFTPLTLAGNVLPGELPGVTKELAQSIRHAPTGNCVHWGIPFESSAHVIVSGQPVTVQLDNARARWLIFSHACDLTEANQNVTEIINFGGFSFPKFQAVPVDQAADYVFVYEDGTELSVPLWRRHQIGPFTSGFGENCFQAVSHIKPVITRGGKTDTVDNQSWGWMQMQSSKADMIRIWINWLWAWENPNPAKAVAAVRLEPRNSAILLCAVTASDVDSLPLLWGRRRKARLRLPQGETFDGSRVHHGTQGLMMEGQVGGYRQIRLDMGQVISAEPRPYYPNAAWEQTIPSSLPEISQDEVLVEYTAHPQARFHLPDGQTVAVADLDGGSEKDVLRTVATAEHRVRFRVVDRDSGQPVPVRLHVHGESDEYLAPMDHHRVPNNSWFQDYGAEFAPDGSQHYNTYIDGETVILVPSGTIYVDVFKGFEIRPVRKALTIEDDTDEVTIELERALDWRSKGWVTADTHVHFLSPKTALLEGAAEGVNVINLLASQWGELFTNVGDFDGRTTFGARDTGGDGEYLVRVGTENRQGMLGHISLLGYEGDIIRPLCSGGPVEAALGDPVEILLTEWAAQCKRQGGVTVIPHFPIPRCEHAAAIVAGHVDGVELSSLLDLATGGLSPYSLLDWYRYLNNGYQTAAVGGTDKMSAGTAVGAARTYARIANDQPFTYRTWQDAIEQGHTFVTLGPLLDFDVDGKPPGSRFGMSRGGGTVDVSWTAGSVIAPMSRVELIVNGEIRESQAIDQWEDNGHWSVALDSSSWLTMLVRTQHPGGDDNIGAHTSAVMVDVEGSRFMAAADALSILQQIEGAMAYMETVGTRAPSKRYREMRLILTAAHRDLHNRLHEAGVYHDHFTDTDHPEHH